MNRIRLSTTVSAELLGNARAIEPDTTDAALIDARPLNEPNEWGDLASWRQSAGAS